MCLALFPKGSLILAFNQCIAEAMDHPWVSLDVVIFVNQDFNGNVNGKLGG